MVFFLFVPPLLSRRDFAKVRWLIRTTYSVYKNMKSPVALEDCNSENKPKPVGQFIGAIFQFPL